MCVNAGDSVHLRKDSADMKETINVPRAQHFLNLRFEYIIVI